MCARAWLLAEVPFGSFVLCLVMGYVLQFGEISHKRVGLHYYHCSDRYCLFKKYH